MHTRNQAQLYFTKNGNISFSSKTILEDIRAENNQVICVLNFSTCEIQFSLLNNAFHFPKAKMEEDFNEEYMQSEKYPMSTFKGTMLNINKINFQQDGKWKVNVTGNLQIHGVTKNITIPAIITIQNTRATAAATFTVSIKDFNIRIPSVTANKIAENVEIAVLCNYQKK